MIRQLEFAFALTAMLAASAPAQCPQWTTSFAGSGPDDPVRALFEFDDDGAGPSLFVGGVFAVAADVPARHMVRWRNGAWSPVGGDFDGNVNALCASSVDGSPALYAGGGFTDAGGTPASGVARWDGATWNALGSGVDDIVEALIEFDDGGGSALYAGGSFTHAGGNAASRVARWRAGAWSALGAGFDNRAMAFAIHDDGSGAKLYAAGSFTGGVAVWNGSSWSTVGNDLPTGRFSALASFAPAGSPPRLYVGREEPIGAALFAWDGNAWTTIYSVQQARVLALEVVDGPSGPALWSGGDFSVARFDGAVWAKFDTDQFTYAVAELGSSQGRACAGGRFGRIDGEPCDFLAEWNGTSWSAIGEPTRAFLGDSRISTFEEWTPPGTQRSLALVGGRFARAGSVAARGVAAWDGASWSALGHGFDGTVTELEPVEDPALGGPALVAIGDLDADASWNGEDIALWDGASWSPIPAAPTGYQGFYDVVVFRAEGAASDTLVVASSSAARVAQWDGAAWTSIGNGFNSGVYVLAVYDAPGPTPNSVYAGGNFSVLNGAPATPVVRWDGASWSNVPGIASSSIGSLFVWDDGGGSSLYACTAGGSRVYRHAGAGWIDMSPPSGTNSVDEFTSFDDGAGDALFLGTRWRWQGGTWSSYDADLTNNGAYALRGFGPGSPFGRALVLGGPFSRIGTTPSARIARLSDPCFALTSYCTAKINSQGCTPSIGWNGEPSVGASATTPFEITASNVLNHKSGILFYGVFGRTAVPFQGGLNCVHSPVHRTPLRSSGGNVGPDDCSGVYTIDFTPWIDGTNDPLLHVGVTVDAQWWSRDPASASTTGLTNAIEFEIRP